MLKPMQEMEARLDQGTVPEVDQRSAAKASDEPRCPGSPPPPSKIFETSLLIASGLLLVSWTAVLGWLVFELVAWLRA